MSNSVEQIKKVHERLASTYVELNKYYDYCIYSKLVKGMDGNWLTVAFISCDCGDSDSCDKCDKKNELSYGDLCEIAQKLLNSGSKVGEIDSQLQVASISTMDFSEDNVSTYESMLYTLLRGTFNCFYATALLEKQKIIEAVKAISKASNLCEECESAAADGYGLAKKKERKSETGKKNGAKRNEKYDLIRGEMYGLFIDRCPPEGWASIPKAVEAILPEMERIYTNEFNQPLERDITRTLSGWIAKSDKCRGKIRSLNKKSQ